eukprot:scaffold3310_cov81-Cylindrotheca_fusiformis.AAC.1
MAKYAYAPLQLDSNQRRSSDYSRRNDNNNNNDNDQLVQERMPMCVAVCVLLAIVFVLSKGSSDADFATTQQQKINPNQQQQQQLRTVDTAPVTPPVPPQQQQQQVNAQPVAPDSQTMAGNSESAAGGTSSYSTTTTTEEKEDCDCPTVSTTTTSSTTTSEDQDPNVLMAQLREKALSRTPPDIIECAKANVGESQAACHLPSEQRYAALGQKGATLWMTGCSASGKTTIGTALEELLVKQHGKHVYRLDGDNLRIGLNRDLTFTESDRAEAVRRAGEMATLFSDAGVITIVGLISPYRIDRDLVRKRHEDQNIPFYEIFVNAPPEELEERDPKGLYA